MKMLESYHFFITLRFHDSGDQESYDSFWKILLILVIIYIFLFSRLTFHANLSIIIEKIISLPVSLFTG